MAEQRKPASVPPWWVSWHGTPDQACGTFPLAVPNTITSVPLLRQAGQPLVTYLAPVISSLCPELVALYLQPSSTGPLLQEETA